jgi:[protein-PII] uridylyltransferase
VDLVLLHDGRQGPQFDELASGIWYPLWDSGLRLDHSVRTPAECAAVAGRDLTAGVGLLDLRVICGDAALVTSTRTALLDAWRTGARKRIEELIGSITERAESVGDAAYLLEPDLKECRGGFRDMIMLRALAATWLTDRPHQSVREPYSFLLDVRDALHVTSGRRLDRLLAGEASDVAALLGIESSDLLRRRVSLAARRIGHAVDLTVRAARQAEPSRRVFGLPPRGRGPVVERAANGLVIHHGEVSLGLTARPSDPLTGLRAAALAARRGLVLSPVTAEHLGELAPSLPDPWPDEAREALLELLSAGSALPPVWEALDLNGCITRWLPSWELIRSEPQHNPVHRHTVDRHSVQTAVEAQRFLNAVDRPDILLLACLLHDIGKGMRHLGVPAVDHAQGGAPRAREIALSVGLPDTDAALIELLVREHLTLAELATRRDHADPTTVETLIDAVDGRVATLELLRALTEADARAAGPTAWSPWRAQLINSLTERVLTHLEGSPVPDDVGSGPGIGLSRSVQVDGRPRVQVERQPGCWVMIIACRDRLGPFSDTAGMLAAHHVAVRSAQVSTVDGIAVNTWRLDIESAADLPDPAYLAGQLQRLADHDQRILAPVRRREARPRHLDHPPHVHVVPEASRTAAVIEVRVTDRSGLLYALGAALAQQSLSIRSAHVTTLAGQAIDTFYLTEPDGSIPAEERTATAVRALAEAASGAPGAPE